MNNEMDIDKFEEYKQVSAILHHDIELLGVMSQDETLTAADLRRQIAYTLTKRDKAVKDPKIRSMRYSALSSVFSLVMNIPEERIEPDGSRIPQDEQTKLCS
jgi:hypothetical protein